MLTILASQALSRRTGIYSEVSFTRNQDTAMLGVFSPCRSTPLRRFRTFLSTSSAH